MLMTLGEAPYATRKVQKEGTALNAISQYCIKMATHRITQTSYLTLFNSLFGKYDTYY